MRWLAVLLVVGLRVAPASAVTALDGRVEVHGYYEAQIRGIDRDFSENLDLTQWWNILSLEIEANVAPDGLGPFDVISVFGRLEVRYDCVWTGACTIFDSADAYRFSSHGKLPKRLMDGRRTGYAGTNYIGDTRPYRQDIPYSEIANAPDDRKLRPDAEPRPMQGYQTPFLKGFFESSSYGFDGIPHFADDNTTVALERRPALDVLAGPARAELQPLGLAQPSRQPERLVARRHVAAQPGLRVRPDRGRRRHREPLQLEGLQPADRTRMARRSCRTGRRRSTARTPGPRSPPAPAASTTRTTASRRCSTTAPSTR